MSAPIGASLGALFIVGRFLYLRGYVAAPDERFVGFLLSALAQGALLLGSLIGAGMKALG